MIIVQISDLHVGSQFLQDKFDQLVDEVNQLHPDVIVIYKKIQFNWQG